MLGSELDAYWKIVVNTIQDGIMIIDTEGTVIAANKALEKILGFSREDLIGKPCSILNCNICKIVRKEGKGHWCSLFEKGFVKKRKCIFEGKDGRHIHALKNAALLYDDRGNVLGAVESIADITQLIEKEIQIEAFRRELKSEDGFHGLLGLTAPMQRLFDLLTNIAQSDAPVIIFGESGTGKELAAKAIHETGTRKKKPFVKVNCAALTETLLESELFGHVKGAYTGAYKSREGRFELANRGDIFLDEIGDLPLSTQAKLLRVLEEKVIERVGDNRPIPVEVRIISATNKNLVELVDNGSFREDLYFRINVIPITMPPLRERIEDIPLLSEAFFQRIRLKSGKKIEGISDDAMGALMKYHWPGNVRELKSAFEYAFVTCHEAIIQPYHLPPDISYRKQPFKGEIKTSINRNESIRKQLIAALEQTGGNRSRAAQILGVSRVTVWNRMKKFNIDFKRVDLNEGFKWPRGQGFE